MRVLALDIALTFGWAVSDGTPKRTISGTRIFNEFRGDYGHLSLHFSAWVADAITEYKPELIAIERGFFRGPMSYHLSGMVWDVHRVAYVRDVPRVEFAPRAIKRFITGSGNAEKHEVENAVVKRGFNPHTDHEADAIALLLLALDRAGMKEAA